MSTPIAPQHEPTSQANMAAALRVLDSHRVAVFIVAYNAQRHIEDVLRRIPEPIARKLAEVYLIDDCSGDDTHTTASRHDWPAPFAPLKVFRTPINQGYGGNQQLGYRYAIERGFDIVVLLHGDGQYAPESLPDLLAAYEDPEVSAVFGTRFRPPRGALRGGMPFYKWAGNRLLSVFQNILLGTRMSELHCGYRSYRVAALARLPLHRNRRDFGFDADIIGQLRALRAKVVEVPIPTYYGGEICYVNGFRYAWQCIRSAIAYRLMRCELINDPRFDIQPPGKRLYTAKVSETSLHHHMRSLDLRPGQAMLDVGGGDGRAVSIAHARRGVRVTCIDHNPPAGDDSGVRFVRVDLESDAFFRSPEQKGAYDAIFALDVLEHLRRPEETLAHLRHTLCDGGTLYASTGNIAFLPMRILLLLGCFNYGRRGILDQTHHRLFTLAAFRRLFEQGYFRVEDVRGFGVPLTDLTGRDSRWIRMLESIQATLARIFPSLFAYQILLRCHKEMSPDELSERVFGPRGLETDPVSSPP